MRRITRYAIYIASFAILLAFCASCSPRIIEHYTVQHDSVYVDRWKIDSLYQRDSIYVRETPDTVYQYIERWRDRYIFQHDTVALVARDTTVVTEIQTVKVEKKLNVWQQVRLWAFFPLIALSAWGYRKQIWKLIKKLI